MITRDEVELLAALLARAGVNQYEAAWANAIMNRLRALAAAQEIPQVPGDENEGQSG